jgi:REP element-mobilizing transposase RayT
MPKKPIFRSSVTPYHLTARSNNREWFYLPMPVVWQLMCDHLYTSTVVYGLRVHAFVLMSNHFHLVASTPENNVDAVMNYFLREVSRAVNLRADRANHVFGGPYKWSVVQTPKYYQHVIRYVYMNPVRARICQWPEEYAYSTLAGMMGLQPLSVPLAQPHAEYRIGIPSEPADMCSLLRLSLQNEREVEMIRSALRKRVFEFSRQKAMGLGIKVDHMK